MWSWWSPCFYLTSIYLAAFLSFRHFSHHRVISLFILSHHYISLSVPRFFIVLCFPPSLSLQSANNHISHVLVFLLSSLSFVLSLTLFLEHPIPPPPPLFLKSISPSFSLLTPSESSLPPSLYTVLPLPSPDLSSLSPTSIPLFLLHSLLLLPPNSVFSLPIALPSPSSFLSPPFSLSSHLPLYVRDPLTSPSAYWLPPKAKEQRFLPLPSPLPIPPPLPKDPLVKVTSSAGCCRFTCWFLTS